MLVVDDHFVVRKGVCALLVDTDGIVVVGEAADGLQAVAEARRLRPQVILMDLKLPGLDGVGAARAILAEQPEVGILILTSTDVEDEVLAAVQTGALGYLAKTSPREDLVQAIQRVAQGEIWLPPRLTRRLLTQMKPPPAEEASEPLTEREDEVLVLLARGWSNRRISEDLSIAEITVRTHVSHIFGKLGVSNRVEAALHALRSGKASLQSV
ncbi:MAG TPA: response regulator transcription factor [Thermoanaerobaculia bacterium]|nr:response regulator transcription factor [Thermoanaerobaculia bacterium]